MKISEIANKDETGALLSLQRFSIWNAEVETLSHTQLLAHYSLLKMQLGSADAINIMQNLKGECLLSMMLGDILTCPFIDWRPPVNDLVAPHLLAFIEAQSFVTRACILVALSENRHISELVNLDRKAAQLMPWSDFSRRVIAKIPSRLGCDYVFWEENTLHRPTPLLFLERSIKQDLQVSWAEFARVTENLLRFEHFAHPEIETLLAN
jgi:hypothetical protein